MKHVLIYLLLIANMLQGQSLTQNIRGRITDAQNNQAIIGANIIVEGSSPIKGTVTDVDGYFTLSDVTVGRHTILITFIGYEPARVSEVLVGSGKEVILDIPLTESFTTLEEIVIQSAEKKGVPDNEMVSVSAMSFNVEETSRYAATFDDPGRAALSFPGVRGSGDDVLNEIVIRGNSPRGMLWRIEGIEVPNPNHFASVGSSGGGISMLSNNMLRTTDFYTGAFPGAYGNATSGVFDIHLRNGNNEQAEYAFEAGLIGIQAAAEGPVGDSHGSYLLNYRYSALALLEDIGVPIDGAIRFQDLSGKLHLPTKNAGTFTLWGLGGISKQDILADTTENEYYNEIFQQNFGSAGIKHVLPIGANSYLENHLAATYQTHTFTSDSLGIVQDIVEDFSNTSYRFSSTFNTKLNARNTIQGGLILSRLSFDYTNKFWDSDLGDFRQSLDDRGHTYKSQGFALWQYRISETFRLNTGLHYMHLHFNDANTLEPRIGFRWNVQPDQEISGGFGLHSRTESPAIYLSQRLNEQGNYEQLNTNLSFTRAAHYVLGYENRRIRDLRIKTELYYQQLFDVPIIRSSYVEEPWMEVFSAINVADGYTSLPLENEGTGINYGLEMTVEKFLTRSYYLMATGSLFESTYRAHPDQEYNTRFNGQFIANMLGGKEFRVGRASNNIISINGRVLFSGNNRVTPINVDQSILEGHTVYDWSQPFAQRLPNYFRVDAGIKYIKNKPRHTSIISLNIQNVTGRQNAGGQYFNRNTGEIHTWEQLGILPNLSYRIEF